MKWIWEQKEWPKYQFEKNLLRKEEESFLMQSGILKGSIKHLNKEESQTSAIEIILEEALSTSKIEGEILNRESVQSSIQQQLGLKVPKLKVSSIEYGTAEMMSHLYLHYNQELNRENLEIWHSMLMNGRRDIETIGAYRKHTDPMQVISGNFNTPTVFYEAPPSEKIPEIMADFIDWFNFNAKTSTLPISIFASLAHLYFEQIHPFEDGNGRIGRALCEKAVSMRLGFPALLSISKTIEKKKKTYYQELQKTNYTLNVDSWLKYHVTLLLEAQTYSLSLVEFILKKTMLFRENQLNERQSKVLRKIFDAGPEGFLGGLSAGNYQSISKAPSATVTRDLGDLVTLGIFRKEGILKGTRYYLL